jgi:tetratricopeptide (TPR) repeat protein
MTKQPTNPPASPAQTPPPAGGPIRKRSRTWLFRGISLAIPLIFLILVELLLRLFHYGYDTSLFIEYPGDKNYFVFNPDASRKYFTDQLNATTGFHEPFRKTKQPNTLRIFVLGESTTIGYPYFHNGSFHRWLSYRLMRSYPEKDFEIINVSLTAVNSYTVRGFADEVVNYQPDAVLIYAGHNEYYGALGVGSTNQLAASPRLVNTLLWLRQFRFVQLMTRIAAKIASLFSAHGNAAGKTRMELMVAEQQIPYGSPLFTRGIDQFSKNMESTLDLFHRKHIPVFLSNLVSNEKDLRPFISVPVDSLKYPAFMKLYAAGQNALESDNKAAAYDYFKAADNSCNTLALCNYYIGNLSYGQGDFTTARRYYDRAKELDALRFRAPDSLNGIIARLCKKYDNAHLVDTRAAFEAASAHGIIGNELILEHVHPNLLGYALMSNVFYEALRTSGFLPRSPAGSMPGSSIGGPPPSPTTSLPGQPETEMTFPQLLQDMPITTVDSLTGVYRVYNLRNNWPFSGLSSSNPSAPAPAAISPGQSSPAAPTLATQSPPPAQNGPPAAQTGPPAVSPAGQFISPGPPRDSLKVSSIEEQLAYAITFERMPWEEAMSQLYEFYNKAGDWEKAAVVMATMSLEHPGEIAWYDQTAKLYGKARDNERAIFYFRKAFDKEPSFDKAHYLFILYLRLDQPAAAMPYLDYAIAHNNSQTNLQFIKSATRELIGLQKTLLADTTNSAVREKIAHLYDQIGAHPEKKNPAP